MRPMQPTDQSASRVRGISLVELVLVMTILPIVIAGTIFALNMILADGRRSALSTTYSSELGFAADWIEHDVRFATSFNPTVTSLFSDPYAPSGGWNYVGENDNNRVLILSSPASSLRQGTKTRVPTYIDGPDFNCSPSQMAYNPVLVYQSVYFLDDKTLYKRYLIDKTTPKCNTHIQKQSCPADKESTWPTECQASDEVIATNVTQFSIGYYTSKDESPETNQPMPTQYTDPESLLNAESISIKLKVEQPNTADPVTSSINLRVTKVN